MIRMLLLISLILLLSCDNKPTQEETIINSQHLNALFEEVKKENTSLGTIWIYCEAPDYHLVTDDDEGYTCVDDVARSLVFYVRDYQDRPSNAKAGRIEHLTNFILYMQADNDYFYNFMFPDKTINKTHKNSLAEANWWSWRAFWALSEMALIKDPYFTMVKDRASNAMDRLLPNILDLCQDSISMEEFDGVSTPSCIKKIGTDQLAVLILGLSNYYEHNPKNEVKNQIKNLSDLVLKMQLGTAESFPYCAFMSWQNIWHAWGNSQSHALLKVGQQFAEQRYIDAGLQEVDHFFPYFIQNKPSYFKVKKEDNDFSILESSNFPQIAYNLRPMIFATLEAYKISKEEKYLQQAVLLGQWFTGSNQANTIMYNNSTGRTFDGIVSASEINMNSGAESTIEGLLSIQALSQIPEVWTAFKSTLKE